MTILGGSLFQCLFPLLWFAVLLWKRWYFGACLMLSWLAINLYDVATYVADASARLLPLVFLGGDYDQAHDWYQILSRLGKLDQDTAIASALQTSGNVLFIASLLLGGLLVFLMAKNELTIPKPGPDWPHI